ncbi:YdiU family protein [Candidimonas sp. SYP-B2681]|uniref:protein adenylyltransferase SelO n=1 Tax=Candidimonas sp. SYP-B2681 TaxID=2497686 RepID=UPI000F87FF29|nr:YdiU family protein [Candidimonas sp. SYP-B2681]RTZ41141.1 YdiU family protein [Candidimonas sp. SYP-B2681]
MIDSIKQLQVRNSFAELPPAFYTLLPPQKLSNARVLHANVDVALMLGLTRAALTEPDFLDVVSGASPLPGGKTLAAVYSGHQFGIWAGQLGDGRAHLLGEVVSPSGHWELQLKGSGRTPYSRMGDGRAVLRSSVREYLAGEAMAGLGIPTTRALALVVADDPVYRETVETAAVVTRVSPSFVRFGSFEHWSSSPENLRTLVDYVIDNFYPECRDAASGEAAAPDDAILRFLRSVVVKTAALVAHWQTAGFCHGVMNTDNMSILGLTIDYGPYGFMDAFQANHVCNHSDTQGRYAWNTQPSVAHWNLYRLASSLLPLGLDAEALKAQLAHFEPAFLQTYHRNLCNKLGLLNWQPEDDALVDDWWALLHHQAADFTLSFRGLSVAPQNVDAFVNDFQDQAEARAWIERYRGRLALDGRPDAERIVQMNRSNPLYVLRNHLAEAAIQAAKKDDASEIETLLMLLRDPYTERPGYERYAAKAPDWACQLEVSCSS